MLNLKGRERDVILALDLLSQNDWENIVFLIFVVGVLIALFVVLYLISKTL